MKINKNMQNTIVIVAVIAVAIYIAYDNGLIAGNVLLPPIGSGNDGFDSEAPLNPSTPTDPTPTQPSVPSPTGIVPTSLMVSVEPNPLVMGSTLYGTIVSNGKDYPITIHALHVGTGVEQTYGGLLGDNGKFYDSNPLDTPGYWDFWATTDTVTSNRPRVTVQGALITSSKEFWSSSNPFGSDPTTTIQVFSHYSGSCLIFTNHLTDTPTSTALKTIYINSNGYATTTFDISAFANGNYELDMIINGIKASDYASSVFFTVGR